LTVPDGVVLPRRAVETEAFSETSDHHHPSPIRASNRPVQSRDPSSRQLFDFRKDDPMRFQSTNMIRSSPPSKSSGDTFVSASSSSNSSYAHSIGSSFTLTSNSTGTSGSSLSGLNAPKGDGEGNNAFVSQLKRLYREITALESRLTSINLDADDTDDEPRFTLQARTSGGDGLQAEDKYLRIINDHKK
jgi:protein SMG6